MVSVEQIKNFVPVSDDLATAGQPSEAQLHAVAQQGFQVVINLGLMDPRYCLADEKGLVQSLGMTYHHIPVDFQAPAVHDVERFFAVMDVSRGMKVFVHCAANMRVSCFVALYGQARLGWSGDKADALIRRIWQPNAVWAEFLEKARDRLSVNAGEAKS